MRELRPDALIDAILAKKNLGTTREMAPLTVALGPGFEAGKDVDFVIETQRGHDLARIISAGPGSTKYRSSRCDRRIWQRACDPLPGSREHA